MPDECSGDTHHFFAADFFAFFGAGAAAAFFAIAESDGGDGGEERLLPNWGSRVPGRAEKCKENSFYPKGTQKEFLCISAILGHAPWHLAEPGNPEDEGPSNPSQKKKKTLPPTPWTIASRPAACGCARERELAQSAPDVADGVLR